MTAFSGGDGQVGGGAEEGERRDRLAEQAEDDP
jgi:hypothetical protein